MTTTPSAYDFAKIREIAQITVAALTHGIGFPTKVDVDNPQLAQELNDDLTREHKKQAACHSPVVPCGVMNRFIWGWHNTRVARLFNVSIVHAVDKIMDLALIYGSEFLDEWDHLQTFPPETKHLKELVQEFNDAKEGWIGDRQDDDPSIEDEHDFRNHYMELHRELLDDWHDENFPEIPTPDTTTDEILAAEIADILTNLENGNLS